MRSAGSPQPPQVWHWSRRCRELAVVLTQCPALVLLDLGINQIGASGSESLAGVLAQCPALAQLELFDHELGDARAESFAGVLDQFPALARLNLYCNETGTVGEGRLRAS